MKVSMTLDCEACESDRQKLLNDACVKAFRLIAFALQQLGVDGKDNLEIISCALDNEFSEDEKKAIDRLQSAANFLYPALFIKIPPCCQRKPTSKKSRDVCAVPEFLKRSARLSEC